jgi:hypothetical protein
VRAQDEQCCGRIDALESEFQNCKSILEAQGASREPVRELVRHTNKVASVLCVGLDLKQAYCDGANTCSGGRCLGA